MVKKGQHCYVYSSIFDPLNFTGIQGLEIQPQVSPQQGLSLIAVPLGWMKHTKSPFDQFEVLVIIRWLYSPYPSLMTLRFVRVLDNKGAAFAEDTLEARSRIKITVVGGRVLTLICRASFIEVICEFSLSESGRAIEQSNA